MPFRTGEIAALGVLKKTGLSPTVMESSSVWLVLKATDVLAACCLIVPLVLPIAGGELLGEYSFSQVAVIIGVCGVTLFALLLAFLKILEKKVVLPKEATGLLGHLRRFTEGVRYISKGKLTAALFMSAVIAGLNIFSCTVILLGFDSSLPWQVVLLAPGIALLLNLVPITPPLGLGATDAVWAGSLMIMQVPMEAALVLALGMRIHQMLSAVVDGSIGLFTFCCVKNSRGTS
jgi:uncharacterized membrane protein YbhN (UPF0104 family)